MNIEEIFAQMEDEELRTTFEEYSQHSRTGILPDGTIRTIADSLGEQSINIFNTEYALLREMAIRFYEQTE